MHMTLDTLVESHLTPAGWIISRTPAAAVLRAIFMLVRCF
jgi:hypothetical protein